MKKDGERSNRSSNFELMRIVLMLLIVAHHSVVNSGVMELWDAGSITSNAAFLTLWGMWGKVCINAFVMVTGYFMCTKRLTWVKVVRLLGQIYFWKLMLGVFFSMTGRIGATDVFKSLTSLFSSIDGGFTASFLVMYLSIPFVNALIGALGKKGMQRLILLQLFVFTVVTTFLNSATAFSEVGWYIALYCMAAYIRLYPAKWFDDARTTTRLFFACVVLSIASVVALMILGLLTGGSSVRAYYLVNDSGKLLAFASGASCFLFFKNLRMPRSRIVNAIASTTFGVLLVHANSDAMRSWLWGDVLDISGAYLSLPLPALFAYMAAAMLGVFACCSLLDGLRQLVFGRSALAWLRHNADAIEAQFRLASTHVKRLTEGMPRKLDV